MSAQSNLQALLAKRKAAAGTVQAVQEKPQEKPSTTAPTAPTPAPQPPQPSIAAQSTHPLALKLAELEEAQDKKLPNRPYILKEIHDKLAGDFELVTQLTEEEIGLIVSNLREHTQVTITPKPKKSQTKRSQPVDLSMLD